MSEFGTDGAATDLQVIEEILAAVAGRPRLAPVAAAASALAAELGTSRPEPVTPDRGAPPGTVPDVDVPQVTSRGSIRRSAIRRPGLHSAALFQASSMQNWSTTFPSVVTRVELSMAQSATSPTPECRPGTVCETRWNNARAPLSEQGSWTGSLGPAVDLDEQWNERQEAGRKKLDEIRKSIGSRLRTAEVENLTTAISTEEGSLWSISSIRADLEN